MKRKKGVIFDLDGTLSDTLESIAVSTNKAIGKFGFGPFEQDRFRYFVGDGAKELLRRCLRSAGDTELEYFDRVQEEYRKIFEEYCMYHVGPYQGIPELLEELKARDIRIAVLSNKPHARTLDVVRTLFGEEFFDCVQGQQEGIQRKPSPEGVYRIRKQLGLLPEELLYVGDTDTDMQTGKAAGIFTVGVLWGFRDRKELEEHRADAIIKQPGELLAYL